MAIAVKSETPGAGRPRIVIFGATGRLGRLLLHRFHDTGHATLSLGRRAAELEKLPGEMRVFDLAGHPPAAPFITPGDIVINVAHARHTAAITRLCPPGINRLIVIGSTRYLTRFPDPAARQVRAAAEVLQRSGIPWVLLHPTMIYGAAGERNVQRMAALIRRFHIIPLPGGGKSLIQPVHVSDVAGAVVRAAALPSLRGVALHLGGPRAVPYRTFLEEIAKASGTWVRVAPLPSPLVRLAAWVSRRLPGIPAVTDAEVSRLQENKDVDITAAADVLGFSPRPLSEGLKQTFSATARPQSDKT